MTMCECCRENEAQDIYLVDESYEAALCDGCVPKVAVQVDIELA